MEYAEDRSVSRACLSQKSIVASLLIAAKLIFQEPLFCEHPLTLPADGNGQISVGCRVIFLRHLRFCSGLSRCLPILEKGHNQGADGDDEQDERDRMRDELGIGTLCDHEHSAQVRFRHGSEDERQYDGGERDIHLSEDEAERTGDEHDPDVHNGVIDGVCPEEAEDQDGDPQGTRRELVQRLGGNLCGGEAQNQNEEVCHDHHDHDAIDHRQMVDEHERAGRHAVNHERPDQNGGRCVAGNAEGQHGGHGAADDGIVRQRGHGKPFGRTFAELVMLLGDLARLIPRDDGGDIAAGAGDRTDQRADYTGHQCGGEIFAILSSSHFRFPAL